MRLLRKILFPFSVLYAGILTLRNYLYDVEVFRSDSFPLPVICVGNLSVGGTGKSPMIEYLISLLKPDLRVASLSRGYQRETKGFRLLRGNETAREVGDEPLQFKKKFPEVIIAVDEKRSRGISELMGLSAPPEAVLLDDAFQHRSVAAGMNILLTSYGKLYSKDFMLPMGDLREPRSGARRAEIIVVTKCPPELCAEEQVQIKKSLNLTGEQELFFTGIEYENKVYSVDSVISLDSLKKSHFALVTGIANPGPLVELLKIRNLRFDHFAFPDHHNFTASELERLSKEKFILTTEKDFMRLNGSLPSEKLYYLPIRTEFLKVEEKRRFDRLIKNFITKK